MVLSVCCPIRFDSVNVLLNLINKEYDMKLTDEEFMRLYREAKAILSSVEEKLDILEKAHKKLNPL